MTTLREALLQGRRRPRISGAGSPTMYRGDGYEFVELREYVAGDDVRRIDWAATARSGELQTRVVLEDVGLTLAAIVDTSRSMNSGRLRSLSESASEAASCWFSAARAQDRCVRINGDDVTAAWDDRAPEHFSLENSFRVARAALRKGSALLVVGDFYDLTGDDEDLTALGMRFDCTALIASDPWASGLPLRGFVNIRDAESGARASLYLGKAERERYALAVREREASLQERFARANWRCGFFGEEDGAASLLRAFGLR